MNASQKQSIFQAMASQLHWIVLGVSLIATFAAWKSSAELSRERAEESFAYRLHEVRAKLEKRISEYESLLRGGEGLIKASNDVTRSEWKTFAHALRLEENYKGVQGLGLTRFILPHELNVFEKQIRKEGFSDFQVWPKGPRAEYTSIVFLEPFEGRNLRAFGYDMHSEEVRREAMERARETGEIAVSGPVILKQETETQVQPGFLFYLPIYKSDSTFRTTAQRRNAIWGWVYAPFRGKDFVSAALDDDLKHIDLEIRDNASSIETAFIFNSILETPRSQAARFSESLEFSVGGRKWTMTAHSKPEFENMISQTDTWLILILGLLIDAVLFILFFGISRKKQLAETMFTEKLSELRDSEDRFFLAVEGANDGIWDWNLKTNEIYFSPRYFTMLGYQEDELPHTPETWENLVHPDDKDRCLRAVNDYLSGKTTHYQVERRMRHKDGSYRWILSRGKVLRDSNGVPIRMTGSNLDLTERKQTEDLLIAAKEEALKATKAKSDFLASMSHEIRTPMNTVVGATSLLLNSTLTTEQKEYVENVEKSSKLMLHLINDILDFSKIEAQKLELENLDFSLSDQLNETKSVWSSEAARKGLGFHIEVVDQLPILRGDPARLTQVINNLISNAIKFTHRGQVVLKVRQISQDTEKILLHFEIEDTGIGITKEAQSKLFKAFSQADASTTRRYGGTGLGLLISRRIIDLMGGSMGVASEEGQGSTFWFEVSFAIGRLQMTRAHSPSRSLSGKMTSNRGMGANILVAEDNEINQKLIMSMLKKLGYQCQAARNGVEALKILERSHFDLILMDCHMPEMDGYKATEMIRTTFKSPKKEIPIIAFTADVLQSNKDFCQSLGMNDYLSKPVDLEKLRIILEKWIRPDTASNLSRSSL